MIAARDETETIDRAEAAVATVVLDPTQVRDALAAGNVTKIAGEIDAWLQRQPAAAALEPYDGWLVGDEARLAQEVARRRTADCVAGAGG